MNTDAEDFTLELTASSSSAGHHRKLSDPESQTKYSSSVATIPHTGTIFGWEPKEFGNVLLLTSLYIIQGVPLGLTFGSVPFLLQSRISLTQIGVFSFASWPYSLKLLWSPIVDSVFLRSVGRRKSWIVPMQLLISTVLWALSFYIESLLSDVKTLTVVFFFLVLLTATHDIAVDGWALELLSPQNRSYGGTCQTIGMNIGYFVSFTIFLTFNSADFCNRFLFSVPRTEGLVTLAGFLRFWAMVYFVFTMLLALLKKEETGAMLDDASMKAVYQQTWRVTKLPLVRRLLLILLVVRIAYVGSEAVTPFRLIEKGFKREWFGFFALAEFPFEIFFAVIIGKLVQKRSNTLDTWFNGYLIRSTLAALSPVVVYFYKGHFSHLVLLFCFTIISAFASNMVFISQGAFFAHISDAAIGGTYLTLLNTVANFGSAWPKSLMLFLVDRLTRTTCVSADGTSLFYDGGGLCTSGPGLTSCKAAGGTCRTDRDGYFYVVGVCVTIGAILSLFLKRYYVPLQNAPDSAWKARSVSPAAPKQSID